VSPTPPGLKAGGVIYFEADSRGSAGAILTLSITVERSREFPPLLQLLPAFGHIIQKSAGLAVEKLDVRGKETPG
jgi:hypothetical protein